MSPVKANVIDQLGNNAVVECKVRVGKKIYGCEEVYIIGPPMFCPHCGNSRSQWVGKEVWIEILQDQQYEHVIQ